MCIRDRFKVGWWEMSHSNLVMNCYCDQWLIVHCRVYLMYIGSTIVAILWHTTSWHKLTKCQSNIYWTYRLSNCKMKDIKMINMTTGSALPETATVLFLQWHCQLLVSADVLSRVNFRHFDPQTFCLGLCKSNTRQTMHSLVSWYSEK